MKTTRILGFVAGVVAVVALLAIGYGTSTGLSKLGSYALIFGMVAMVLSLLLGVAHLLLRIRFKNPYRSRRPKPFLKAGRIMVWVWGVAMVVMAAMVAYLVVQFGPVLISLISG